MGLISSSLSALSLQRPTFRAIIPFVPPSLDNQQNDGEGKKLTDQLERPSYIPQLSFHLMDRGKSRICQWFH